LTLRQGSSLLRSQTMPLTPGMLQSQTMLLKPSLSLTPSMFLSQTMPRKPSRLPKLITLHLPPR
jgi:hypothetical protein